VSVRTVTLVQAEPMSASDLPPLALPLPTPVEVDSEDGTTIAAYDLGGPGADLLLVHATGFCAGVWTPIAALLPRYRRAALDVRGHGRSGVPQAGMHWDGTARDVLATVDALGLERPFGVGHSMGGASLVLAEQARPGTFRGLWLFEPIIFPPVPRGADAVGNSLADGARRRRSKFDSPLAAYENFARKPPLSDLSPAALSAYVHYGFEHLDDGAVRLRCAPEVEAATYEMGGVHHAFDHLAEVQCPVTVVRGTDRFPGPASFAPQVADGLPHGRLEDHPELGHFGPLQDPAAMAASIELAVSAAP
jgi:pimeloyl-ACP methyl ester carboxylesterase